MLSRPSLDRTKIKLAVLAAFFSALFVAAPTADITAQSSIPGSYTISSNPAASPPPKPGSLEKVRIVEILSFACNFCDVFNKDAAKLKKRFGDKIEFVHYPLIRIGPNPARLYYLSVKEGKAKSKELKDLLFSTYHDSGVRNINDPQILGILAKEVDLQEAYKNDFNSPEISEMIRKGLRYASDFQVRGTPTLIIEDSLVTGGDPKNLALIVNSLLRDPVN